jgi:hypothetical protein
MVGLVVTIVVLLLVLAAQLRPRPLLARQLLVLPIVALAVGAVVLAVERPGRSGDQLLYFTAQVLLALATGVGRGMLIEVTERRQFAIRRGGWLLLAAWAGTIAVRVAFDAWVRATAASGVAIGATFPLFLGTTLAAQNAILGFRVHHRGLRYVTSDMVQIWRKQRQQWRQTPR